MPHRRFRPASHLLLAALLCCSAGCGSPRGGTPGAGESVAGRSGRPDSPRSEASQPEPANPPASETDARDQESDIAAAPDPVERSAVDSGSDPALKSMGALYYGYVALAVILAVWLAWLLRHRPRPAESSGRSHH